MQYIKSVYPDLFAKVSKYLTDYNSEELYYWERQEGKYDPKSVYDVVSFAKYAYSYVDRVLEESFASGAANSIQKKLKSVFKSVIMDSPFIATDLDDLKHSNFLLVKDAKVLVYGIAKKESLDEVINSPDNKISIPTKDLNIDEVDLDLAAKAFKDAMKNKIE